MRILLVTSLFPPDKGVSTHRMGFFHRELSKQHQVDVLKFGDLTCLNGNIKTIDKSLFISLAKSYINRKKIEAAILPIIKNYDLIIVSAPPYNLYEIANIADRNGIKFILDLRDQPDLIYSERKNSSSKILLKIKLFLTNQYINSIASKSLFVSCVGGISSAITQKNLFKAGTKVVNVHNGFIESDIKNIAINNNQIVDMSRPVTIGCVGSLHKFRATNDLYNTLTELDKLGCKVHIKHWGTLCTEISEKITLCRNISYEGIPPISRDTLLVELSKVDAFLLPCSNDLIWEPTTSVFDYILFEKPVIFCGLQNNEAYAILETVRQPIITTKCVKNIKARLSKPNDKLLQNLLIYSRENSFSRFIGALNEALDE